MNKIQMACQLYSVHKSMAQDFEGTIRKVAEAGYKGVEFFGALSYPAERVKAILDETDMEIVGWHSSIGDFSKENIKDTISYHKAIGNRRMVVPGLPQGMICSAAAWHETAKTFREIGKVLANEGMRTGYHNHYTEFTPIDGEIPWDILGTEAGEDFILQIDNGNAMHGKADPMLWLKKYPGRAQTFHFKPYSYTKGYDVVPGEDDVPWKETVAELYKQNATEWVIAEYETEALYPDVEGVTVCYKNLVKFL